MQSEKRLRGRTFYVNPDSGADSRDRRSVSSRWQWSRSHFVRSNNTAFLLPSSRRADRPGSGSGYVTLDQSNNRSYHRPAGRLLSGPPPHRSPTCHRGRSDSGSCFKGGGWSRQLILRLKEGNKCQAALGIYIESKWHDVGFALSGNHSSSLYLRVVYSTKYLHALSQHFILLYNIKPCCLVTTAQRIFTRLQFPSVLHCWTMSLLSAPFCKVSVLHRSDYTLSD